MIAPRYVPAVGLLLALTLVPVIIHSYVGATSSDGRSVTRIPTTLAGFDGTPTRRNANWGNVHFESDDWFERAYRQDGKEVVLTVVRSYDLKRLYHHAENDIAYGTSFVSHDVSRASDAQRPVHILRTNNGETVVMYLLHYDDEFVADPLRFQLRTAGALLVAPRKAMTLFFARQDGLQRGDESATRPLHRVLFAAIDQFLAQGSESGK